MFLCFLSIVVKASLLEWWKSVVVGVLLLCFCALMVPYSIQSSRLLIEGFMAHREALQYVAIVATLECAISLGYAFRDWSASRTSIDINRASNIQLLRSKFLLPIWWIQKHYFSLLILPSLFFLQSQVLYVLPGINFYISAGIVGGVVLLLIPLLSWLCRKALPNRLFRENALLVISIALSIVVLISTNHEEVLFSKSSQITPSMASEFLMTFLLCILLFTIGFVLKRLYKNGTKN